MVMSLPPYYGFSGKITPPAILQYGTVGSGITLPAGTDMLIVAGQYAANSYPDFSYNGDAMTRDAGLTRTSNYTGIFSLLNPSVGGSYNFTGTYSFGRYWAMSDLSTFMDTDYTVTTEVNMAVTLDIRNAYSAFYIATDYFTSINGESDPDMNSRVASSSALLGEYVGAGGTGIGMVINTDGTSNRIGFLAASYKF